MRIGIDCDGVLRDFIGKVQGKIRETHPELASQLKTPYDWEWTSWVPFWEEQETDDYVFIDHFKEIFGESDPIQSSLEDWEGLVKWAKENEHELVLVSAQRPNCKDITDGWLQRWGFMFPETHYTREKWSVDVDVMIDDDPKRLNKFAEKSVSNGSPIIFKQTWNEKLQDKYMSIDRLSDLKTRVFG